jgi:hypothetical protein
MVVMAASYLATSGVKTRKSSGVLLALDSGSLPELDLVLSSAQFGPFSYRVICQHLPGCRIVLRQLNTVSTQQHQTNGVGTSTRKQIGLQ